MSKLDFQPRRCESDNFRGFSFIGDKFQLPERTASEEAHYWNNVDDDGASLSECASSVFDEDLMETSAPEPIAEPQKKKRPPRKKKKKQAQVPMETTDEGCENKKGNDAANTKGPGTETDAQKTDDTAVAEPESDDPDEVDGSAEIRNDAVEESVSKEMPQATLKSLNPNAKAWSTIDKPRPPAQAQSASSLDASAPVQQQDKPTSWASLAVGEKASKPGVAQLPHRPAPPPTAPSKPPAKRNGWATVGKPTAQGKTERSDGGWSTVPTSKAAPPRLAVQPQSQKKSANGWSTVENGGGGAQPAQVGVGWATPGGGGAAHQQQASAGRATPLSPDWTSHAMSPRGSSSRNVVSGIPPPPLDEGGPAWPSLGDFPPPPGGTDTKPAAQQAKPAGSWGKPAQGKKSAWGA